MPRSASPPHSHERHGASKRDRSQSRERDEAKRSRRDEKHDLADRLHPKDAANGATARSSRGERPSSHHAHTDMPSVAAGADGRAGKAAAEERGEETGSRRGEREKAKDRDREKSKDKDRSRETDAERKERKEKKERKDKDRDKDKDKDKDRERSGKEHKHRRRSHSREASRKRSRSPAANGRAPDDVASKQDAGKTAAVVVVKGEEEGEIVVGADASPAHRSTAAAASASATAVAITSVLVKKQQPPGKKEEHLAIKQEQPVAKEALPVAGVDLAAAPSPLAAKALKPEPLSLEELLKKKKLQQAEESKPKFLSKKEREALALERLATGRQATVATQSSMLGALRTQHAGGGGSGALPPPPSSSSRDLPLPPPPPRQDERERDRDRDRDRDARDMRGRDVRDSRDRDRDRDGRGRDGGDRDRDRDPRDREPRDREPRDRGGAANGTGKANWAVEREREKELEMIKQQYLGKEKEKKKMTKASEKFRFNFDWDAKEDTSRDLNPLYNNTHEAALLFGRGMRAGIDRREQKKLAAVTEKDSMRRTRAANGEEETAETRQVERARAALADSYGGNDMRVDKHWTEKTLAQMTDRDWRIFREDFSIAYKGSNTVLPIRNWDESGLPKALREAIDKVGYKKPSPIQMAAIPLGLKFRDVIGVAETGSGKTAAFVLPMLTYIMKQPVMTEENEADGPYSVVLAPTRELAQQIEEETVKLAQLTKFRITSIVGGQSIEEQGAKLRRGCEIVVATPGRLIDCIERHYAVLNQCNYVVLDEADRMIDLGFEPQVMGVLDAMPHTNLKPEGEDEILEADRVYRTTYMFSATMPPAVERLARKYLRRPVVINIGSAGKAVDNITQRVIWCKENEKASRVDQEMAQVGDARVIVFVNTKRQCDNVHAHLENVGHRCTVLHGGKSQDQREAGIKGFRDATYNVLIATDVAGRGIDVPDVALVVNYDMPNTIEAYTHRIGRTGRAGKKGASLTLLTAGDSEVFYDLKKFLEDSKAVVPPELARHEAAKVRPGGVESKRDKVIFSNK